MEDNSLETVKSLDPVNFLRNFTNSNVRPEHSRPFHRVRRTTIVKSVLPRNTYGSALLQLGHTQVVTAITLQVGHPGPSHPTHGDIEVNLTISPLCSKRYNVAGRVIVGENTMEKNSPVDPNAIESFVQRTIRTCGIIDMSDLGIEEGKSAFRIKISIVILNHDGNVEDASLLCAVAALADTKLPQTEVDKLDGSVRTKGSSSGGRDDDNISANGIKLKLRTIPVPLTIGLFDNKMLVDPTSGEEQVLDGIVTIVMDTKGRILNLNKTGGPLLSAEDMAACVQMGLGRAKEVEPILIAEQKGGIGS